MMLKSQLILTLLLFGAELHPGCVAFVPSPEARAAKTRLSRDNFFLSSQVGDDRFSFRQSRRAQLKGESSRFHDWGIERWENPEPRFPSTVQEVSHAAAEAIMATLNNAERLDPNIVSNAMSRSLLDYRPTRQEHDRGRIGIEIDGARHLFPRFSEHISDQSATREVALNIAAWLSKGPWEGFEKEQGDFVRPVAVYFNTVKQSLVASRELALLKERSPGEKGYDEIIVRNLAGDSDLPTCMLRKQKKSQSVAKGYVDPRKGFILVVQPSDFNSEYQPPGPAIDRLSHLQRLCAMASVHNVPVVIISPRFLVQQPDSFYNWDQSGYQQSSVYGGMEPPKGPTPWLMRDFTPPIFVWVGKAHSLKGVGRISLFQSVMNLQHAWHSFFAPAEDSNNYQYLGSTKTSTGRPTVSVMQHIFQEWQGHPSNK